MAYTVYRDSVATFLDAKRQVTDASPINLISIHVKDSNATLYFAQYVDGQSITYYKPGTSESQVYTPAPFTIGPIQSNIEGRIDALNLEVTNIGHLPGQTTTISDLLHTYDGLRGAEVNVLKVFRNGLSDPNSYMRDIYYIDSCTLNQNTAQFTLTSKVELQDVSVPFRKYRRDQCQFSAGGVECGTNISNCQKTLASCEGYSNLKRFGGFPSIPTRRVIR